MKALSRRTLLGLAGALCLIQAGCGYSSGLQIPEGYQTVGVSIFANKSKVPDLERDLHLFISRRLRDTVSAPLTTPDRADIVVEGQIEDYSRMGGTRGNENELLESGVAVTVRAWLVDRESGERIGEVVYSGQSVGYRTIEVDGEERSRDRSLSYVAEGLVLDLFARHSH